MTDTKCHQGPLDDGAAHNWAQAQSPLAILFPVDNFACISFSVTSLVRNTAIRHNFAHDWMCSSIAKRHDLSCISPALPSEITLQHGGPNLESPDAPVPCRASSRCVATPAWHDAMTWRQRQALIIALLQCHKEHFGSTCHGCCSSLGQSFPVHIACPFLQERSQIAQHLQCSLAYASSHW